MQVTQLGINVWETGFRNSAETQHENNVIINKAGYSLLYCMYQHFVEIYICVCVCGQIDQEGLTLPERSLYLGQDEDSVKVNTSIFTLHNFRAAGPLRDKAKPDTEVVAKS